MTATKLRPVTLYLYDAHDEQIGEFAARVVPTSPTWRRPDAWVITHALGSPAGGMHTEVVFVDDSVTSLPTRVLDDVVRHVANKLYAREWAFHYLPELVPDRVLRHGSLLRERVEVSAVEVWHD